MVVLDFPFSFLTSRWGKKRALSSKLFLTWGNSSVSGVLGRVKRSKFILININDGDEAPHMALRYACCNW